MCRFVSSCKCVGKYPSEDSELRKCVALLVRVSVSGKYPGEDCKLRKCVALLVRVSVSRSTRAKTVSSARVSLC